MAGDTPIQPAYEIYIIECRFSGSSPYTLRLTRPAHEGVKEGYFS